MALRSRPTSLAHGHFGRPGGLKANQMFDNTQIFAGNRKGIVLKEEMKVRFRRKNFVAMA
jgi:hypothetical protein